MVSPTLVLKIDVDTERGTRIGVPNLLKLFAELDIPATFLFSLGPDNTGRAIKRVFRPGFLKKVSRTSIVSTYGVRTLLNGLLFPGPHIAKRHAKILLQTQAQGHEVGIHCYDHVRWQDKLSKMTPDEVMMEFNKAQHSFAQVFGRAAKSAGAAGWQANAASLAAYDAADLLYGSDARGEFPFFPHANHTTFKTLQIPTTLPTLDELIGRPEYPYSQLADHYFRLLKNDPPNVFTMHAEIEGMQHLEWFRNFLIQAKKNQVQFVTLETIAHKYLQNPFRIPVCELIQGEVDGRSGTLAMQGAIKESTALQPTEIPS